jgi:hypothetical protein
MTFCHFLVLFLLSVDWLGDPHFGQSRCSRVMTSTPATADQQIKHHGIESLDQNIHVSQPSLLLSVMQAELDQIETPRFLLAPCIPS